MAMTQAIEAGPPGQYGGPQTGPDVIVRVEGRDQRFRHPTAVTIGRHPSNTVVTSNASVSRFHARVDPVPGGWTFSNASSAGSFINGSPVERVPLEDNLSVRLGHPTAGLEVEIAPVLPKEVVQRRAAAKKRARRLRAIALTVVGVLVVIALVIGGVLLVGNDDDGGEAATPPVETGLTSAELDSAKIAAVWIGAQSTNFSGERVNWSGSGSIIDSNGTILTNAHVAEPQADGLAEIYGESGLNNPEYLFIAVLDSADDTEAEPKYRARVLASDGMLDASVIQIYAEVDGDRIDPSTLDLPTVPIGDSDELRTGDHITVLGYPGISQSPSVTVTSGLVSSFIPDEMFDSERAEIDTDARIAPGNSGGMAINDAGELVGIPSSLFATEDSGGVVSGRIRAINLVKPLIDEAT
jgi:putative serine protease PepD